MIGEKLQTYERQSYVYKAIGKHNTNKNLYSQADPKDLQEEADDIVNELLRKSIIACVHEPLNGLPLRFSCCAKAKCN